MRIIGGIFKGMQLTLPSGFKARPTTDFAREGLFNILTNSFDLETISVLDLFSGTGCISYEFLSRGCRDITSVEMDHANSQFIKQTSLALIKKLYDNDKYLNKRCDNERCDNERCDMPDEENKVRNAGVKQISFKSLHHNVFDFLKICNKKFDIVFADPPYDLAGFSGIPEKILSASLLENSDSILIFEHPSRDSFKNHPCFVREKKYGNVHFTFFSAKKLYLQNEESEKT
ncbi:MAG: RsmD family RNA methyltransferase [Bacteroidales bacterium]|nr:RsmD family RNA methyltransferase [Bacteroidales bacterium]